MMLWQCALTMAFLAVQIQVSQSMKIQKPGQKLDKKQTLVKNKHKAHKQNSIQWKVAPVGSSCEDACATSNEACSESALQNANSEDSIKGIVGGLGRTCNPSLPLIKMEYPALIEGDQCGYTLSCNMAARNMAVKGGSCQKSSGHLERLCPCQPLNAFGDPHLSNMHSEFFDVNRVGVSTFLNLNPQTKNQTELRVDAMIDHPGAGSMCFGFYIRRLWVKGSLVGKDLEVSTTGEDLSEKNALVIKVGGQEMRNVKEVTQFLSSNPGKCNMTISDERVNMSVKHNNNRIKFASLKLHIKGTEFVIDWSTGDKKPNILEFHAKDLMKLGSNWGGILASDDHTWVESMDPSCKKSHEYANVAQLYSIDNGIRNWNTGASL